MSALLRWASAVRHVASVAAQEPLFALTLWFGLCLAPPAVAGQASAPNRVHVPEPMIFDLVRALGAGRGELEANTLVQFPLDHLDSRHIEWAPEVEFAVADGVALELELPFEDSKLEAYKIAGQVTFGQSERRRFIHGSQVIAEGVRGKDRFELTGLYVTGTRIDERWSALAMIGMRTELGDDAEHDSTFLLNGTLFMEPSQSITLGLEANYSHPRGAGQKLLLMPQVHYELGPQWSIQLGLGAEFVLDSTHRTASARVIWTRPGQKGADEALVSSIQLDSAKSQ